MNSNTLDKLKRESRHVGSWSNSADLLKKFQLKLTGRGPKCVFDNVAAAALILLVLLVLSFESSAQDESPSPSPSPSATPSDEEIRLDEKIKILEKKILLEQKKKELFSVYPTPSITPLPGTTTGVDKMTMEVEIQTYRAMQSVSDGIACEVNKVAGGQKLILFDTADFVNWQNYKLYEVTFRDSLNKTNQEFGCWLNNRRQCVPTGSDQRITYERLEKDIIFMLGEIDSGLVRLQVSAPAAAIVANVGNYDNALTNITAAATLASNRNNAQIMIIELTAVRGDVNTDQPTKDAIDELIRLLQQVPAGRRADVLAKAVLDSRVAAPIAPLAVMAGINTGLFAATTTLKSAIEILSYFRTDTDLMPLDITIDRKALKSSLGRSLLVRFNADGRCSAPGVAAPTAPLAIYDFGEFGPFVPSIAANSITSIVGSLVENKRKADIEIAQYELIAGDVEKLNTLDKARIVAKKLVDASVKKATALQEKIIKENKKKVAERDEDKIKEWADAITALNEEKKALDDQVTATQNEFDEYKSIAGEGSKKMTLFYRLKISRLRQLTVETRQFLDAFTQVEPNTGISPFIRYSSLETLSNTLAASTPFWLNINVIKAGGTNRVRKNLVRFFSGPEVSHNGAVMIQYDLYDSTGAKVASDTRAAYLPYQKSKNIFIP